MTSLLSLVNSALVMSPYHNFNSSFVCADEFDRYCNDTATTPAWGGHLEVSSLVDMCNALLLLLLLLLCRRSPVVQVLALCVVGLRLIPISESVFYMCFC